MVRWPAGLPYESLRDSYKLPKLGLPQRKSEMQSGKIRQRKQFTLRISTVQMAIVFLPAQLATFRTFIAVDLGDGGAEFIMPTWIAQTRTYGDRVVQIVNGAEGIAEDVFAGDRTLASFSLAVRNL